MEAIAKQVRKGRGGARKGSGMKPGTKIKRTLQKEAVQRAYQQRIFTHADRLFTAQLARAVGSVMVYRVDEEEDANGKIKRVHTLVTDAEEIKEVLDETEGSAGVVNEHYYFVTEVPPDNKAIDSMLDRALGKSVQQVEVVQKPLTDEDFARELFRRLVEQRNWKKEDAIEGIKQRFPELDVACLVENV